ncbi:Pre-rRNA-processing protein esf1 [Echria macrotheca]|uniref:Pre-rRNA-processing protein esf1 n=1 Tax=Echria macrotheca TaxID=438768 RepID=A0AAJ0F3G5_9PEZI|nr:Pre-rRNA-processing protein esf1 [Echria macrotheca]
MPKTKPTRDGAPPKSIKDPRFANFETDPRYQLPSKKNTKTKLDNRFSRVLSDPEFTATAKVDRYGRKLKTETKKKALQRLYEVEGGENDEQDDENSDDAIDDDEIVQRELAAADEKYDPARGGGFASSDSDSDSDSGAEEEEEGVEEARPGIHLRKERQAVETGEVTNRIAIVNIDWDHIKSVDLMALFSSFVPPGGRIEKVSIYPSEFGKERMQREELEGPPKEIFKKSKDDDLDDSGSDSEESWDGASDVDSDEEVKKELLQEGNDQDFDSDALRTYQLDRLRYYYAVAVFSDSNTAHKIYEATDGSEYLSSSNFLDLRFVPDNVAFDDEPRDECDTVPPGYKPVEFVTDALQHSKVKLTWDMHPEEVTRKESIKQAFAGSRAEIAENDLRAYLASDSEDEEEVEEEQEGEEKLSKKELARRKMRAALGLGDEQTKKSDKSGPVGEMQITFTPALTGKDTKKDETEETTLEKYKRKERERKEKKRAKMLAKREGVDGEEEEAVTGATEDVDGEDLGFDDPFFTAEPVAPSKAAIRKEERLKKRAAREAEEAESAAQKAQLERIMGDDDDAKLDHFDMKEIMRAEKQKGKKKKKGAKETGVQDNFDIDVEDNRFKAVFDSHEFAIDPSNPKFKATQGMKKLLEEGRKKRKAGHDEVGSGRSSKKAKPEDLDGLINSVKRKAAGR